MIQQKIAILGGGNIGSAIAAGLVRSGDVKPDHITVTRRKLHLLYSLKEKGVKVTDNNKQALDQSEMVILAVRPRQMEGLLQEISSYLNAEKHILVSVVTAFPIARIVKISGDHIPVFRAMPNTAASVCESVTGLSAGNHDPEKIKMVQAVFERVGRTYLIEEQLLESATIMDACAIAYFLRVIRAFMQGGIQIGFHASDAQMIAAQVAKGAASLLLETGIHPEEEIDKVTTPRGVTIAGLNEMEHHGMSSALIKGITASFHEIEKLRE
ncbi:MAG: pyrroline-5-carboxylate reductase [Chlorobi bacterium]|nr:pyrroline-5-carboxylate reductase [Chlorobiota bacterium]